MAVEENDQINFELAQFENCLFELHYTSRNMFDVEWIFETTNCSHKTILPTDYMLKCHSDLIGDSAIHRALKRCNVYKTFLRTKIDLKTSSYIKRNEFLKSKGIPISKIVQKQYLDLNLFSDPRFPFPNTIIRSMLNVYKKSENIVNYSNKNGITVFHVACMANDSELVEMFLNNEIPVDHAVNADSPIFPGFTPLHFAAVFCSVQTVKLLLSRNASVTLEDTQGKTAMRNLLEKYMEHAIVYRKRLEENKVKVVSTTSNDFYVLKYGYYPEDYLVYKYKDVVVLLSQKIGQLADDDRNYIAIVNIMDDGSSARALIDMNLHVNVDSKFWPGSTSLHFVALYENIDTILQYVSQGLDIEIKDANGITAFDICVNKYEARDIYKIVLAHPTWNTITFSDGKTKLTDVLHAMQYVSEFKEFLKTLPNINSFHVTNTSPLWAGFTLFHLVTVLFKNSDEFPVHRLHDMNEILRTAFNKYPRTIYSRDASGLTAIEFAFCKKQKHNVRSLLSLWASADIIRQFCHRSPCLHIACAINDRAYFTKFICLGNDINKPLYGQWIDGIMISNWTPLHFAVAYRSTSIVRKLARLKANVQAVDVNGMTPIHILLLGNMGKEREETFDCINRDSCGKKYNSLFDLAYGRDNVVNNFGLSHLHVACYYGQLNAAHHLIKNGAEIDAQIYFQYDPNIHPNMLSTLANFNGCTPLALALAQDNVNVVRLLFASGANVFVKSFVSDKLIIHDVLTQTCNDLGPLNHEYLKALVANQNLQDLAERTIGLTKLHIACNLTNVEMVRTLLDSRADANAQIRDESPVWAGNTPLHVLDPPMNRSDNSEVDNFYKILNLLLNKNADVTITNNEGETPVHIAYEEISTLSSDNCYLRVNALLRAQKDFNVNPTTKNGLSHFHMACSLKNLFVVKKFLNCGKVDVNEPIKYFTGDKDGCTPLHLVLSNCSPEDFESRLEIVDLLLKHGANVNAKDILGDTPLHKALELNENSTALMEILIRKEPDMNCRNVYGITPLEAFIEREHSFSKLLPPSVEELAACMRCGCHFNDYNPATNKGYLALALSHLTYENMKHLITIVGINQPKAMKPKYKGRTVIHNIVSHNVTNLSVEGYINLIDQLTQFECNIDDVDEEGKTALHLAVQHQNTAGVRALILLGVDIRIHDLNNEMALNFNSETCLECECTDVTSYHSNSSDEDEIMDEDYEADSKCAHVNIREAIFQYALKLQWCGLYGFLLDAFRNKELKGFNDVEEYVDELFISHLDDMRTYKIPFCSVTFGEFILDSQTIMVYRCRDKIIDFFDSKEIITFRKKYGEVSVIIQYQYRRALEYWRMADEAKEGLFAIACCCLPDYCWEFILNLLSKNDLKTLSYFKPKEQNKEKKESS